MKALNPSITDGAPVTADGVEIEQGGHRYHYAGHYTDRVDLDGNRLTWEWYDVIDDETGDIIARASPYTSDDRIKAVFGRLFRKNEPHGFTMAARWPSAIDPDAVNITVPADIVARTGLKTDDELRIKVYSVGPHPIALGRRLFHLSQTGASKTAVLPLSLLSQYKASQKYDAGKPVNEDGEPIEIDEDGNKTTADPDAKPTKSAIYGRGPRPGEYVALVVEYDLRTRRRELADIPKQTEDPNEPLTDRVAAVEAYADARVIARSAGIIETRREHIEELHKSISPETEDALRHLRDQAAENLAADPDNAELAELAREYNEDLAKFPAKRAETLREIERLTAELWKQEPPNRERVARWAHLTTPERYADKHDINEYLVRHPSIR